MDQTTSAPPAFRNAFPRGIKPLTRAIRPADPDLPQQLSDLWPVAKRVLSPAAAALYEAYYHFAAHLDDEQPSSALIRSSCGFHTRTYNKLHAELVSAGLIQHNPGQRDGRILVEHLPSYAEVQATAKPVAAGVLVTAGAGLEQVWNLAEESAGIVSRSRIDRIDHLKLALQAHSRKFQTCSNDEGERITRIDDEADEDAAAAPRSRAARAPSLREITASGLAQSARLAAARRRKDAAEAKYNGAAAKPSRAGSGQSKACLDYFDLRYRAACGAVYAGNSRRDRGIFAQLLKKNPFATVLASIDIFFTSLDPLDPAQEFFRKLGYDVRAYRSSFNRILSFDGYNLGAYVDYHLAHPEFHQLEPLTQVAYRDKLLAIDKKQLHLVALATDGGSRA